jgi:uncharacterized repeat protein (TIGR03943 family)
LGLIALAVIALSAFGFFLIGKPVIQKEWSPAQQRIIKQAGFPGQSSPIVSSPLAVKETVRAQPPSLVTVQRRHPERVPQIPERLQEIQAEKPKVQATPPTPADTTSLPVPVPATDETTVKNTELPQQMRAVINPDGSVEIQKAPEGLIRYETWNFMELNDDIYDRINAYRGEKVQIEGYVYRRSDFEPGYFVAARLYMWCCAMCAAPVGPLCKWDQANNLNDGDWIRVEGTIEPMLFHDTFEDASDDIPLIKVEKVERIPKLENPYVYLRNTPPTPGQCKLRST